MNRPITCFAIALLASACSEGAAAPDTTPETTPASATPSAPSTAEARLTGDHLWQVDPAASRLVFRATQEGAPFEGEFREFDVQVNLDPEDLSDAAILAVIDPESAFTGDGNRDGTLPGPEWFDVVRFPEARFRSDDVSCEGGACVARGDLTIKETTRAVELPFTLRVEGDRAVADGGLTLVRLDYDLGTDAFVSDTQVGYPVEVVLHVEATR